MLGQSAPGSVIPKCVFFISWDRLSNRPFNLWILLPLVLTRSDLPTRRQSRGGYQPLFRFSIVARPLGKKKASQAGVCVSRAQGHPEIDWA